MLDTNDAPVVSSETDLILDNIGVALSTNFLPDTPFNLTGYEGFDVEELVLDKFIDYDGDYPLGVAILGAQNTTGIGM